MFGYFGNQFGKVPCNIVRPVRPQYTFYKALQGFKGKYIDELTYKEKDLIKDLGIRISGKDLACEIQPNLTVTLRSGPTGPMTPKSACLTY